MLDSIEYFVEDKSFTFEHLKLMRRLMKQRIAKQRPFGNDPRYLHKLASLLSYLTLAIAIRETLEKHTDKNVH